eukprot:gene1503-12120_t
MEERKEIQNEFISAFCNYLEQIEEENNNYKIALTALKGTLPPDVQKTKQQISLFEVFKSSKNKSKSIAQFLDFPSNLPFETIFSIFQSFEENTKVEYRQYHLKLTLSVILSISNIFYSGNLREDAVLFLQFFRKMGLIEHVEKQKPFSDSYLFSNLHLIQKSRQFNSHKDSKKFLMNLQL